MSYKIVRMYFKGGKRTIKTGLTLAEAQAHCSDPESSSSTATSATARARTRRKGAWFDGYDAEPVRQSRRRRAFGSGPAARESRGVIAVWGGAIGAAPGKG